MTDDKISKTWFTDMIFAVQTQTKKTNVSRGVNPGGFGGRYFPEFEQGSRGVAGGRGRVVKYYNFVLLCTGSMLESGGDFGRGIE